MALPLLHPFTGIVAGPTECGKSFFVFTLLENASKMIQPPPEEICYCYGEFQCIFSRYPDVNFHEGLPDATKFDGPRRVLSIIDDLIAETNDAFANLFTKGSHHRNVIVLYLTRNIFHKN